MKGKIAICQLDGKIPNLALMKVAGYYESNGHVVEHYKGPLFWDEYERVYMSKIFSFTPTPAIPPNAVIGGTGIDFYNRLPPDIESHPPSYSLYKGCNFHLGFSMKGCRFNCKFCCVPKKEGRPYGHNTIEEILTNPNGGDRLMLLDNDFFGGALWRENLESIERLNLQVCFMQGLNIRIITQEQANMLSRLRYRNSTFKSKYLTFAWDKFQDEKLIKKGIEICLNSGIKPREMQFFVLIGYDTTPEQDFYRVEFLRDLGCKPFVMPYDRNSLYQRNYARYVNNRAVFNSTSWEDYKYNLNCTKKTKMQNPKY